MPGGGRILKFFTGGGLWLPAFWHVDGLRLRVFDLPMARRAHANQVLLTTVVRVGQCQVWSLPERVDVVHRVAFDDCGLRTTQEREVAWVLVAPASMPLRSLYLVPLFAPDGAGIKLCAAACSGDHIQHPASRPGIWVKRRRCGGK